jgi:hypothetical protein
MDILFTLHQYLGEEIKKDVMAGGMQHAQKKSEFPTHQLANLKAIDHP